MLSLLLRVRDNAIRWVDERKGVISLLIYLSAASDRTNCAIVLNPLSNTIGVDDHCLSWFIAYLTLTTHTTHGVIILMSCVYLFIICYS